MSRYRGRSIGWIPSSKRTSVSMSILFLCRQLTTVSVTVTALKTVVITGTTRTDGPPRPILGPRVCQYVCHQLKERGHSIHAVLDPIELQMPLLEKPHFAYAKQQVPSDLDRIAQQLQEADAFVTITPELNHAPSPGLVNILNHFGSSLFSYKPSAIVTYSAGQWGGTRAAQALRPILSELGCLPVSAMIHIPKAGEVLDEEGIVTTDPTQWEQYTARCFSQLEWWATAARLHRQEVDPFEASPAMVRSPSQRNSPDVW